MASRSAAGSTENSPEMSSSRGKTDAAWAHCVTITCEDEKEGHDFAALKENKKRANDEYNDAFGEGVGHQRNPQYTDSARERRNEFRSTIPEPKKSKFMERTTLSAQPTNKSVMQSKEAKEECDLAISRWMIDANIPFSAVNSTFYQPMIDAIASMGPGYKGPKVHAMRNYLLGKHVIEAQIFVDSFRSIWKETGCTIMADGWSDTSGRTLINFLAYCPRGMVFIKSVDASEISKTAAALFDLFKDVVLFVGPENVVHIVTDNGDNYMAAGKLLELEFPSLYWSPCAAHCVDLMLQDIGKLDEVSAVVLQASNITKYVYNHCYPLHLMRKFTGGRELIRPSPTRFATNFIALQSILSQKDGLRAMVASKEWTLSAYAKETKGRMFEDSVLNAQFWKECGIVVQVTEPLIRVLSIVNSEERPAMGYIYSAIQKAREEMVMTFQRRKERAEPYLKILESHWDRQLHKNLHAAGHWLNPRFQYKKDREQLKTVSAVIDVIEKYAYNDQRLQSKLTSEMRIFKEAKGDFGRKSAISYRNTMLPDEWWLYYGGAAPNLQKLAIRVLSQTCSSSGRVRNRSVFEQIHSKKRNRLEHQRMIDLVYCHYNLRLQQRNGRSQNIDPIDLAVLEENLDWVVEEDPPALTVDELQAFHNSLAACSTNDERDTVLAPTNNINVEELFDFDDDFMDTGPAQGGYTAPVSDPSSHPWNVDD